MSTPKVSFTSRIGKLDYLMGVHYVEVPATIVKKLGGLNKQRLFCSINKHSKFQCGMMALGEGRGYITINKKKLKEFSIALGDKIDVTLEPDKSEFGMEVPEELIEIFAQDPEAEKRFMNISGGKQRNIIYYVIGVKNSDKRIERALKLINNLKACPEGKETARGIFLGG
ncbi:MAG: YdeI/OmpD-associated family protein [Bacteroidetes bacterium]|nr:YdeI/OmpD-associated family protein [Bacteroidota bacterium]